MSKKKMMNKMRAEARKELNFRAARIPSGKVVQDKRRKNSSRQALKRAMQRETASFR